MKTTEPCITFTLYYCGYNFKVAHSKSDLLSTLQTVHHIQYHKKQLWILY